MSDAVVTTQSNVGAYGPLRRRHLTERDLEALRRYLNALKTMPDEAPR